MNNEPLALHETVVEPGWLDEYGHMNMAFYMTVCDAATYAFWELMNDNVPLSARAGMEYAVVEAHVNYMRELQQGASLRVTTQLLGADGKRFRLFHRLYNSGDNYIAATNEIMSLGFDLNSRRIAPFRESVRRNIERQRVLHAALPAPDGAGRGIHMPA